MRRNIQDYLRRWKESARRKPLVIRGARQVGKTWVVDDLGENAFEYYLKVNPEKDSEIKNVFQSRNPKQIINELNALYGIPVIEGKTLLFIDEVQLLPDALASLRYFYEDFPGLHIIVAGSLLDHALSELPYSMPVGRVEFAYMYPLTFNEFLLANGQEGVLNYLNEYSMENAMSEAIHKKLLQWLRIYFFIGGMPEAVKTYIETNDFTEVEKIQSSILTSFRYDFAKYGTRKQQEHLGECLDYAARNVGHKVKYVNVNKSVNSAYLKEAFNKLEMSRVIRLVRRTRSSKVPINQHIDHDTFKPLFLDIGLACNLGGIKLSDISNLITDFEGMLAEQFVGQELLANSQTFVDPKLYYWSREAKNSNAEVDYMVQVDNDVFPLEVKAGKTGKLRSLQVFLAEKELDNAIRLNTDLPGFGKGLEASVNLNRNLTKLTYNLLSLPIYMTQQIERQVVKSFRHLE